MSTSSEPQHEKVIGFLVKRVSQYLAVELDAEKHSFISHGLDWKVDGKGVVADGQGYVMFDCKRRVNFGDESEVSCRIAYQLLQSNPTATVQAVPLRAQTRDRIPNMGGTSVSIHLYPNCETDPYDQIAHLISRVSDINPEPSELPVIE
ncbi:MAG: hypothetical protein OER96_11505 [Gammaproteobacteria bacterium]|nr:hypothetical protein [Gammaproteobacteria bacterium]